MVPADFSADPSFIPVKSPPGDRLPAVHLGQHRAAERRRAHARQPAANVRAMGKGRATTADVFVSWLPLYHDMGLIGGCFATMYWGFPVVLCPLAFLARPSQWLRAIHRHRGTISGGPNSSYEPACGASGTRVEGLDLSSWRFAFNGAEPVSPETMTGFTEKFSRWGFSKEAMSPVYGLAECSVGLAFTPPGTPWQMDTLDREHFYAPARRSRRARAILRRSRSSHAGADPGPRNARGGRRGLELPDRSEGALQFRGPTSGYRNPEATRELFDGEWLPATAPISTTACCTSPGARRTSSSAAAATSAPTSSRRRSAISRACALRLARPGASGTERIVVLAETRQADASTKEEVRRINDLALNLIGSPVDDIVLAPPHTVPKTSSGKIRRVAARDYYERARRRCGRRPGAVHPARRGRRRAAAAARLARRARHGVRCPCVPRIRGHSALRTRGRRDAQRDFRMESGRGDDAAVPALRPCPRARARTSRPDRWCWRRTSTTSMRSSWYRCSRRAITRSSPSASSSATR